MNGKQMEWQVAISFFHLADNIFLLNHNVEELDIREVEHIRVDSP